MKTNYGQIVERYETYKKDFGNAEYQLGHRQLLEAMGPAAGLRILDFGCGPANFSQELSGQNAQIIGLDADPAVIERARSIDPKGEYRIYRGLLAEELAGRETDAIIATFSFCLIPDRELRYILRDMRQLLRPGGRVFIVEPNQGRAHGIQYANLHYHRKEGVQSGDLVEVTLGSGENAILLTDDIYRTHEDYRQLLEEAGFTIERWEEPKPGDDWGDEWDMERQTPPFLFITATR